MAEYVRQDFGIAAVARDLTVGELHRLVQAVGATRGARIVVLVPKDGRPRPMLGEGQILTRKTEARPRRAAPPAPPRSTNHHREIPGDGIARGA